MILRKPYAFFIKQFKLIHLILTALIAYLIYRTGLSLAFFNEYISTNQTVIDQDLTGNLFNIYMFVIPFLIILASVTILSVMQLKKKPILFYVTLIIIYIAMLFVYNHVYSTLLLMEGRLIDIRTVRMARDFLMMGFVAQALSVIITFVRATGFDIQKFNFGQDLAALEISEEDREEFEVEVNLDTDKVQRKVRRNVRFARYIYVENRFLINLVSLVLIATICFVVYLNLNIYNKVYSEKDAFLTSDFSMWINKSYITREDYEGNVITGTDHSFVVLEISLKNNFANKQKLDIARTQLVIGDKIFYHDYNHRERLFDLGRVYDDTLLPNNFTKWLLVYKVPNNMLVNQKISFRYVDKVDYVGGKLSPKYINVTVSPKNLDQKTKSYSYNIKDEVSFSDSILGDVKLVVNKIDIANQFKLDYQFCVNKDECYQSYEYLKPSIINQHNKTLLYLNGFIEWDEKIAVDPIPSVYKFIDLFGTFVYEINGETKIQNIILKEVRSLKIKRANDYYIELLEEVQKADKISIIFKVRDVEYKYTLK